MPILTMDEAQRRAKAHEAKTKVTLERFYSAQLRLGKRIVGEVSYRDELAAIEMGTVLERVINVAGEDNTTKAWSDMILVLHTFIDGYTSGRSPTPPEVAR